MNQLNQIDRRPQESFATASRALGLSDAQASDFAERELRVRQMAEKQPAASFEEITRMRDQVRPEDEPEARLFTQWCVLALKEELAL